MRKLNLTRRDFLRMAALGAAGTIVAACGGAPAATPTTAPAAATAAPAAAAPTAMAAATAAPAADAATAAPAAEAPTAAAAAAPTAAAPQPTELPALSAGPLKEVPRNRTLNLGWSISDPIGTSSPWAIPGYTHQSGNAFLWEPLSYFGIFADKEIPWLADSMEYTKPDFTELTIKLNKDAAWSDGQPVTSKDIVFTFEGQLKNDKLPYHTQFDQFVKDVKAVDDKTARDL